MTNIKAAITGIHGYAPKDLLTNHDLEKMVDTSDDWIVTRTGIKQRHILKGEDQGTSVMGAKAVKGLLEKTNTKAEEIDLIICATTTPDMVFPATANLIAAEVGAVNSYGYDLQAACSGFIYSLVTASKFIESGAHKKIVVVGCDKMSSIVDYTDRSTCVIFGDGAGAVLIEPNEEGLGIQDNILKTDGKGAKHLHMKAGGSRRPSTEETVKNREHFIYQEGSAVFKHAVKNMSDAAAQIMERNNLTAGDIAYLAPHQANLRIIEATSERMGITKDKVMINIHNYGNTTNGTIPLTIFDHEHLLKKGDNLILAAFGGGFTWGSIWMKWAYNPKK